MNDNKKLKTILLILFTIFLFEVLLSAAKDKHEMKVEPINPAFLRFLETYQKGEYHPYTASGHYLGYIPAPVNLSNLKGQRTFPADANFTFPASYDLRTYNRISSVRNQGSCGSCWAFAAIASLESTLLPGETKDFSEMNLKNTHGFDWTCCNGGNQYMALAYLARWSGPWNETDDPYANSCTSTTGKTVQKHIQDAIFIWDRATYLSNDDIKKALMLYGAVHACFYYDDPYYNTTNKAYYYNGTMDSNHCVAIAGWDDNYSKSKFNNAPAGNGAFLVKNSWGTAWGANGYFYMSYYDTSLGEFAVFEEENTTAYSIVYQYDPLGYIAGMGWGASITEWFANIFTASGNHNIMAASFYVNAPNSPYELYIYRDVTTSPTNGTLVESQTGTLITAGYHTILLKSPVPVTTNQKFSVVVKLTTPGSHSPIPLEYRIVGYSTAASASPGQSFFALNEQGTSWEDLADWESTTNVCIKAFAAPVSTLVSQKPAINDSGSSTPNGIIETNETVNLTGSLMNTSSSTVTSVTGTLTTNNPITINNSHAVYPNINPGASQNCTTCYSITAPAANRFATHWDIMVTETPACSGCLPASYNFMYHVGSSFSDVPPGNPFYAYVEKLLHNEVTSGCTSTAYCPSAYVQRQHMAKFICNAMNAASPGSCSSSICNADFSDVPDSNPFCPYIEALYSNNIVSGCQSSPLMYCPTSNTQRQDMAKFVCNARNSVNPGSCVPTSCTGIFTDVPASNPFCGYIEALYNAYIISGCGSSLYCPTNNVARDQMAKFLVNAFGLSL